MTTRSAVMESRLIKCLNCGLVFGEDEAEVCRRCHEHICPECGFCGCPDTRQPLSFTYRGSRG